MAAGFTTIVITAPESPEGEAALIERLLRSGAADCVHLRKPDFSEEQMRCLVSSVSSDLHGKLRLHSCFSLLKEFDLAGVQLNSRAPYAPHEAASFSRSCHSIEEVMQSGKELYVTLSPVFDSISKPGYKSRFPIEALKGNILPTRVIALGGIVPECFPALAAAGFSGAAMLGYVWEASCLSEFENRISEILKFKSQCCNI